MTTAERALIRRLRKRAKSLAPGMVERYLIAYDLLRTFLTVGELEAYLRNGYIEQMIQDLLSDEVLDPAFSGLRQAVDRAVLTSAQSEVKFLPKRVQPGQGIFFDTLNPRVIDAARELDTRVIQGLKSNVRETVRQHTIRGLQEGVHPRTVARTTRSVLELAPNQEEAIRNFRRMLEQGDREALTRALRDRRFDRTLQKALGADGTGLSKAQIDTMAEAYRRKMVAFNANTHARTAAIDAQKLGQRLSWEDAIERGVVRRDNIAREWVIVGSPTGDGRNRPEHLEMDGEVVSFDERYSNGQLVPGDTEWGCRCAERFFIWSAEARLAA